MALEPHNQSWGISRRRGSWFDLPAELRLRILGFVPRYLSGRSLCVEYATVCSEWQMFFERITFRNLIIRESNLDRFGQIVGGKNAHRTHFVEYIWLHIYMPNEHEGCPQCKLPADPTEVHRTNKKFTRTIEKLLGVLSTWTRAEGSRGVTLELNLMSRGNYIVQRHGFPPAGRYPFKIWDKCINPFDHEQYSADDSPLAGLRPDHLPLQHVARYSGYLIDFDWLRSARLPPAPVIGSLVMRRRCRRQLSPRALGQLFRESLIQATSFRLERWCRAARREEDQYLSGFRQYAIPSFPKTLQNLHYASEWLKDPTTTSPQVDFPSVLDLMTLHRYGLKELVVVEPSGTPDDFVEAAGQWSLTSPLPWMRLERVCFRSGVLNPGGREDISRLLVTAAHLAERMPNLRCMEIFNTEVDSKGNGCERPSCLFRYRIEHPQPIVSWVSTWRGEPDTQTPEFSFTSETKSAWAKAALEHTGHALIFDVHEPRLGKGHHDIFDS